MRKKVTSLVVKIKRNVATCSTFWHLSKMETKCRNIGYQMSTYNTGCSKECLAERRKESCYTYFDYVCRQQQQYYRHIRHWPTPHIQHNNGPLGNTTNQNPMTKNQLPLEKTHEIPIRHQSLFFRPYPFTVLGTYTYKRCPTKRLKKIRDRVIYRLNQWHQSKEHPQISHSPYFSQAKVQQPQF